MPFSGGTFSRIYNWVVEQASPPIEISKLDTQEEDFASGLSNCILRDGTGVPTASIGWNSQNLTAVNQLEAARFVPTGSVVPSNGMYLPAANTVGFATNGAARGSINATGNWSILAPSSGTALAVTGAAGGTSQTWTDGTRSAALRHSAGRVDFGATTGDTLSLLTNDVRRVEIASDGSITFNNNALLSAGSTSSMTIRASTSARLRHEATGAASGSRNWITSADSGGVYDIAVFNDDYSSGAVAFRIERSGITPGSIFTFGNFGVGSLHSGVGSLRLEKGLTTNTGYISFINASGTREAYIGYSSTTGGGDAGTLPYVAGIHAFTGRVNVNSSGVSGTGLLVQVAAGHRGIEIRRNSASGQSILSLLADTVREYQLLLDGGTGDFRIRDETGSANRLVLSSGGNWTFNAPGSGVTLAVNGVSGSHSATIADAGGTGGFNVGYLEIPQNSQSANYTCVRADSGKHIYHPSGAGAGDTFTIPSNASVPYPVGTVLTFVNSDSNSVSIAINTDTLTLAGSTSTGTRTLAQNGVATAIKVTSTSWIISGTGLT